MSAAPIKYQPTRYWLEQVATLGAPDGVEAPLNPCAFLLQHGREFGDRSPLPKGVRQGPPKYCYANAGALALDKRRKGRYVYCEGFATNIIPTMHAWCYDRETGLIVDPTWERGEQYIGLPFRADYVRATLRLYVSQQGDTPFMNLSESCPVLTGEHAPELWEEDLPSVKKLSLQSVTT